MSQPRPGRPVTKYTLLEVARNQSAATHFVLVRETTSGVITDERYALYALSSAMTRRFEAADIIKHRFGYEIYFKPNFGVSSYVSHEQWCELAYDGGTYDRLIRLDVNDYHFQAGDGQVRLAAKRLALDTVVLQQLFFLLAKCSRAGMFTSSEEFLAAHMQQIRGRLNDVLATDGLPASSKPTIVAQYYVTGLRSAMASFEAVSQKPELTPIDTGNLSRLAAEVHDALTAVIKAAGIIT